MANPVQTIVGQIQQNRMLAIGLAVAVVLILAIGGFMLFSGGGKSNETGGKSCNRPLDKDQKKFAMKVSPIGKAVEIQALLASAGITLNRVDDDTGKKADLSFADGTTLCQRDTALISVAQSGLLDKNIGLEIFEKGDLTASREEKRIKLVRAQQGELARLIRKLDTISDATVSFSIPEHSIFTKQQKAMSVTVQVRTKNGERLTRDKVRTVINLVVGSVQQVDAQHVALSDTNGNTYNSVLDASSEFGHKMEERDLYMRDKVARQLNRLSGVGNYVVTVSTQLREEAQEVMTQSFDPNESVVSTRQRFSENLNARSGNAGLSGGPASGFVPNELKTSTSGQSSSNRGYRREGEEISYANTKTQKMETRMPGMIEDISIAVTLDEDHFPKVVLDTGEKVDMDTRELQRLIARSASPRVNPSNVSIARISFGKSSATPIQKTSENVATKEPVDYMPYAVGAVLVMLAFLLFMFRGTSKDPKAELNEQEIQRLQEVANQQQQQLQATQQQTQLLMEAQQQQLSDPTTDNAGSLAGGTEVGLQQTLGEIKEVIEEEELDDEEIDSQIRSWIESS